MGVLKIIQYTYKKGDFLMSESLNNQTKKCKHCQSDIPKKAKVCPNCRKKQGGIMKWIIIAVVAVLLFSCGTGNNDGEKKPSNSNPKNVGNVNATGSEATTKEEVDNVFEVGEIVETSDLKISFISSGEYTSDNQFIQPKDGYVFYRMEFEFENLSDSDTYVSTANFTCYADDYDMEAKYFDSLDLNATLSKGKKTKGSVFFEVPKDAKEIVLEYELNFITEDKVIFKVK